MVTNFNHSIYKYTFCHFFGTLVLVLFYSGAMAQTKTPLQNFTYNNVLNNTPKSLYVRNNPATGCTPAGTRSIKKATLYGKLNMGDDYRYGNSITYNADISVDIKGYTFTNGTTPIYSATGKLKINSTSGSTTINPEQLFSFDFTPQHSYVDYFVVTPHFVSNNNVSGGFNLNVFYSEEFAYAVPSSITIVAQPVKMYNNTNTVTFKWGTNSCINDTAPNYQFQLLRLYNTNKNATSEATITTEIDWNKALTIETGSSADTLMLTLAEGTGYYLWRVRPIGNYYKGGIANDTNWGAWSSTTPYNQGNATINGGTGTYLFFFNQQDDDKNWIYSRTFVEGDTRNNTPVNISEKMVFANGLQMVKQTQAKINTDNKVIANQTIQDYSGRPALTTLAAPLTSQSHLKFKNQYIKNSGDTLYTAKDFDADHNYRNSRIISNSDLTNYYSNSNTDATIPNAEGYAFTRTLYFRDGTNRPQEQSSPGSTHRIRSGSDITNTHTTRNSYAAVADQELVRLFGDEAPAANSVHKTIATDANNTSSVSYISKEGQVIATCLSTPGSDLLLPLDSKPGGTGFEVYDTITGSTKYTEYGFTTVKNITFTQLTDLNLDYSITPPMYDVKLGDCSPLCLTCDYKVSFFIKDLDNPENNWDTSVVIYPATEVCNLYTNQKQFARLCPAGNYLIEKRVEANIEYGEANTKFFNLIDDYATTQLQSKLSENSSAIGTVLGTNEMVELSTIYHYLNSNNDESLEQLYAYLGLSESDNYTSVKVAFSCDTLTIPIKHCATNTCSGNGLEFEAYMFDKWGATYGNNLSVYMPLFTANGQFATVISNMLAENNPNYTCDKLWTCWKSTVDNYFTTIFPMYTELGKTPPFLLDLFLNCTGYMLQGVSSDPTGTTGYRTFPYKYFQYTSNPQNYCEQVNFNLEDPSQLHTFSGNSLQTSDEWYRFKLCIGLPDLPTTASGETIVGLTNSITDTCAKVCKTRFESFRTSLVDLYESKQISVIGSRYLYSNVNPILDSVPQSTIYCQAQSLEDECMSMCTLTIGDSVGNYQQNQNIQKAMTYAFELELPENGVCANGFTQVNRSVSKNKMIERYLNDELSEFKQNLGYNGDTFNYAQALESFDPSISNNSCFAGELNSNIYINNDFKSAFELASNSSTETQTLSYNDGGYSTVTITYPKIIAAGHTYTMNVRMEMLQYFQGSYPLSADFIFGNSDQITVESYAYSPNNLYGFIDQSSINTYSGTWYSISGGTVLNYSVTFHFDALNNSVFNVGIVTGNTIRNLQLNACPSLEFINKNNTNDALLIPVTTNCINCGSTPTTVLPGATITTLICDQFCSSNSSCAPVCIKWKPLEFPPANAYFGSPDDGIPLYDSVKLISCAKGIKNQIKSYLESQTDSLIFALRNYAKRTYMDKCVNSIQNIDKFVASYSLGYYHYTLYYYDRAGNLVKTVPPKGVAANDAYTRKIHPPHTFVTEYQQNSLKQNVRQKSPDGGETKFIYNAKSQLRFSQNAKQLALNNNTYSYTKYDELGRITEVGEISLSAADNNKIINGTYDNNFPTSGGREITRTVYSVPQPYIAWGGWPSRYLQNRVSYSITDVDGIYNYNNYTGFNDHVETMFSYDPHGNVEWIGQWVGDKTFSYIAYEYDLLSGSVLKVKYNDGQPDQFFHRYTYDADKRIKTVETSRDNVTWEKDATYQYYAHGPLKRKELGQDKVQGVDYVYTIQGWLKGMNHSSTDTNKDPSKDGQAGLPQQFTAKDVYGMMLTYFAGDFNRTNSPYNSNTSNTYHIPATNLFNGNISSWTSKTDASGLMALANPTSGNAYRYDELNRIKTSTWYEYSNNAFSANNKYNETFAYDANGNIDTLKRYANGTMMDNLIYHYANAGKNQLTSVSDAVAAGDFTNDIDNQSNGNYIYDAIGNLTGDASENMSITWNVYGKIKSITKPDKTLSFLYNASGNRVLKEVTHTNGGAKDATVYMTDASGNQMAVYTGSKTAAQTYYPLLAMAEQPIYGSDRLGINTKIAVPDNSLTGNSARLPLPGRYTHTEATPYMYVPGINNEIKLNTQTGTIVNNSIVSINKYHTVGNASIFNNAGNCILRASNQFVYANNTYNTYCYLYNGSNQPISNTQNIPSDPNSQCALVKVPNQNNKYYLFTVNAGKVYYHLVDMNVNNGKGAVDAVLKNKLVNGINNISGVYAGNTMKVLEDRATNQTRLYMPIYYNGYTFIAAASITDYNSLPASKYFTVNLITNHKSTNNKNDNLDSEIEMLYDPTGTDQSLYFVVANNTLNTNGTRKGELIKYKFTNAAYTVATRVNSLTAPNNKVMNGLAYNPKEKALYYKMWDDINAGRTGYTGPLFSIGKADYNLAAGTTVNTGNGGDIRTGMDGRIYIAKPNTNTITVLQNGIAKPSITVSNYTFLGKLPVYNHVIKPDSTIALTFKGGVFTRSLNGRNYELTDHLQNSRIVLSDLKTWNDANSNSVPDGGELSSLVLSFNSYYAFGAPITQRNLVNTNSSRVGFNGQEKDDEVYGSGNLNTAMFWEYDTRLGRRWNQDPKPNTSISNYAAFANNPISFSDELGDTLRIEGRLLFRISVKLALASIMTTKEGARLVNSIHSSPSVTTIRYQEGKFQQQGGDVSIDKKQLDAYGGLYENSDKKMSFSNEIAHELKHAEDYKDGKINQLLENKSIAYDDELLNNAEVSATNSENLIAAEKGKRLRDFYFYNNNGNGSARLHENGIGINGTNYNQVEKSKFRSFKFLNNLIKVIDIKGVNSNK